MNDELLGGLDEEKNETNIVSVEECRKKRKAFHEWEVNGTYHKLKLKTAMIERLENKYKDNLLNVISKDGVPPLSVMLTVIQAAIQPWEHGIAYKDVMALYDSWLENNDGNQMELLNKVIIPTMAVSGFFMPEYAESIMNSLDEAMNTI